MPANGTYTLLELTQIILSALDSDEVNSIDETIESTQVALLLKTMFHEMSVEFNLEERGSIIELNPSLNPLQPVLMYVPDGVSHIENISYNNKEDTDVHSNYAQLTYVPFQEFLMMATNASEDTANWASMSFTVEGETFEISYRNDAHPTYYTDIGGYTLLFNSFNSAVDTTLQKSKTLCTGTRTPTWVHTNIAVPPLRPSHFPLYINKAKARAFVEIKQMGNDNAEKAARRLTVIERNRNARLNRGTPLSHITRYGRRI